MSFLDEVTKNKQIILVGNSNQLNKLKKGQFIDSHEIVIRFNLAIRYLKSETTGIKTDIWSFAMVKEGICKNTYNCATYKPKITLRYGSKVFNFPESQNEIFENQPQYKQECIELLELSGRKIPSSGFVILYYLTKYCFPKSITLIGFDSFENSNFYTDLNANEKFKWHDSKKESQYIKDLQISSKIPVTKI